MFSNEECIHYDVCTYGENRSKGMYCNSKCLHYISKFDFVKVRCRECRYCKTTIYNKKVCVKNPKSVRTVYPSFYCKDGRIKEVKSGKD